MLKSYMYTHRRGILAFVLMMIAAVAHEDGTELQIDLQSERLEIE